MRMWDKYIKTSYKINLDTINVAEAIAYANLLIAKIAWLAIHNKYNKRLFNKFFETAALIIHATVIQHGYRDEQYKAILKHIDEIEQKIKDLNYSRSQIGLLLGNLSEYVDTHYTFTELIAFVNFLANEN